MQTAKSTIGLLEALQDRDGVFHLDITVEEASLTAQGWSLGNARDLALESVYDDAVNHVARGLGPSFIIICINATNKE